MYSIALILVYYGKLPDYFPLWLKSAGANKAFDFMIFSDIDFSGYKIPDNVHVHYMTLDEIRARTAKHLDFDFVLDRPYKLCDYKPLYGLIFEDYLEGFEFWGHVDADLIWGDMSKFITPNILNLYDKFFHYGHLVIYRNTDKINRFILHELPGRDISYRDVYAVSQNMCFDESKISHRLFMKFSGGKVYDQTNFADIHTYYKEFRRFDYVCEAIPAFRWKDGKLFALTADGKTDEYIYIHLQKRVMRYPEGLDSEQSFMIVPNEFIQDHELTEQEIKIFTAPDSEYEKRMREKYKNVFKSKKTLKDRLQGVLTRNQYEKIMRLTEKYKMNLDNFLARNFSAL